MAFYGNLFRPGDKDDLEVPEDEIPSGFKESLRGRTLGSSRRQITQSLLENLCGLLLGCDADSAGLDGVGEDPHSSGRNLIGHGGSGIDNGGVSYSPAA
jgi:hypothetical protein